jgi:O-antigen/teichoic acid export membrane protein
MGVLLASVATLAVGQFFFIRRAALKVVGCATPEYNTKEWVKAGLPLVIIFGFTGFFLEINIALAGAFLSRADLAVYNLAFQIANLIAFFLVAVGYQFGPHASRLYGEGRMDTLQTLVSRTAQIRIAFAIAMFGALALVGGWILRLFSPAFEEGYTALLILAATQVVAGIAGPVAVLQNILGLQRSAVIVSVSALVLNLALTPILATRFGIDGAAMAVLVTMTVWNVLLLIAVIRNTAIEPSIFGLRNVFGPPHRAASGKTDPELGSETDLRLQNSTQDIRPEDTKKKTGTG